MKGLIVAVLFFILAQTVFAQSYVILQNGVLLSVDESGMVYDFSQFVKSYEITAKGKNYIITKDDELTVISNQGFVYKKGTDFTPKKLKANAGVWMLSNKGELSVITKEGFVFKYDKEEKFKKMDVAVAGGNYIVLKNDKPEETTLVAINEEKGFYTIFDKKVLQELKLDPNTIQATGGNHFITNDGVVYTVSSEGFISNKEGMGTFKNTKTKGGNYFVDETGALRVVLSNGYLLMPYIPANMGSVKTPGYNYFVDSNDDLILVKDKVANDIINSPDAAIFDAALQSIVKLYNADTFDGRTVGIISL